MKISREKAVKAAEVLTENMLQEIEDQKNLISEFVTEKTEALIPKDVLSMYKKHPEYFRTSKTFYYESETSQGSKQLTCTKYLPYCNHTNIQLPNSDYDELIDLTSQRRTMAKEYEQFKADIVTAILAFGTMKVLEDEFPKAHEIIVKQFPVKKKLVPSVPIESILKRLEVTNG